MTATPQTEIVATTIAYCWALDEHRWGDLTRVFVPDATAFLGRRCDGLNAIAARVREALEPLDASQHLVANHVVDIDGDRASSRCYFRAQHIRQLDGTERQFEVGGIYADAFVRTADGWRIRDRMLTVRWTTGDPAVLA